MDDAGSVTRWLIQAQEGSPQGANALWDHYFRRLAAIVRNELPASRRRVADESDVALSAFRTFFEGVQEGRFADLRDRDQIWRILVVIAKRKAISWIRHETAKRRGGGWNRDDALVEELSGSDPTPATMAAMEDELRHLLDMLKADQPTLALIATRKCEGYSNHEIAEELAVSVRTIERKLLRIHILWAADLESRFGDEEHKA